MEERPATPGMQIIVGADSDAVEIAEAILGASQQRSIKLQISGDVLESTGVSSKEQRRLTDEWPRRHGSR
jgi:hypothetical protein